MSSKLVKKGLDFVSSTNESIQEKRKNSQKKKRKSRKRAMDASYQGLSTIKKGKVQKKDDFTEQNLKYFKHSAWSIKKETYEKIVQYQEKKLKKEENPTTEEIEDEEML